MSFSHTHACTIRAFLAVTDRCDDCFSAAAFPYFHAKSKTSSEVYKQRYHLIGVLVHGVGSWVYTMADRFKTDSNVTIEVLQRVLIEIEDKKGRLPSKLYLQMDNCVRENKNKFVIGYLSWLVQRGVFQEIQLSFLPVGHTHEDIDQMFSRIAVRLRQRNAVDQVELFSIVTESFEKYGVQPECRELTTVANISEWIKEHLNDIHGHADRRILHYQILPHPDGAMLKTKNRSTHPWGSYHTPSTGFHLLKSSVPKSFAGVLSPPPLELKDNSSIVPKIRSGLVKLRDPEIECRISEESFCRLEASLNLLADLTPIPFSWSDYGKFKCEQVGIVLPPLIISAAQQESADRMAALADADIAEFDADTDDLNLGTLLSGTDHAAAKKSRDKATVVEAAKVHRLEVNNLVVMHFCGGSIAKDKRRFSVGRVLKIHRKTGNIQIQWMTPWKFDKDGHQTSRGPEFGMYLGDFVGVAMDEPVVCWIKWKSVLFIFKDFDKGRFFTGVIPATTKAEIVAYFNEAHRAPTRTLDDTQIRPLPTDAPDDDSQSDCAESDANESDSQEPPQLQPVPSHIAKPVTQSGSVSARKRSHPTAAAAASQPDSFSGKRKRPRPATGVSGPGGASHSVSV